MIEGMRFSGTLGLLTAVGASWACAADWPQWRGPSFNGVAQGDGPTEWSDTKNVAWKAEIPGRGYSTPVIAGHRIFVTTAIPRGTRRQRQLSRNQGRDVVPAEARARELSINSWSWRWTATPAS